MGLTTKQYHTRISGLLNAGLIKRHKGKYFLTLLGKIVYDCQLTIGKALTCHWKLKAIESIEMSASKVGIPEGELAKLIDTLIDNRQIKDILMNSMCMSSSESRSTVSERTPSMEKNNNLENCDHTDIVFFEPACRDKLVNERLQKIG